MLRGSFSFLQLSGVVFALIVVVLGVASGSWALVAAGLVLGAVGLVTLREAKRRLR